MQFRDRSEAGQLLGAKLARYADRSDVRVLALPRGGVPVAYEVARRLRAPLDVFVVRKLGVPGQEELAMGAIASGGIRVLNEAVIASAQIPPHVIDEVARREEIELLRREEVYRGHRPAPDVQNRTVILVDDGIATGSTMQAAILALRQSHAGRIIVAAPTVARETFDQMRKDVEELIAVIKPDHFCGVGEWYEDFSQTTDEEVRELLSRCRAGIDSARTNAA